MGLARSEIAEDHGYHYARAADACLSVANRRAEADGSCALEGDSRHKALKQGFESLCRNNGDLDRRSSISHLSGPHPHSECVRLSNQPSTSGD